MRRWPEGTAEDGVDASNRRRGQGLRKLAVEGRDVLWLELVDSTVAEGRLDVMLDVRLVAHQGARADTAGDTSAT
jgi:hypothetical protein